MTLTTKLFQNIGSLSVNASIHLSTGSLIFQKEGNAPSPSTLLCKGAKQEQTLWHEMKHSSTTCYYLPQLYNLLLIFNNLISSAIRSDLKMNSWQKILLQAAAQLTTWRKFSSASRHRKVLTKILLLTLHTNGIQILASLLPFCVKISQPACSSVKNYLACTLLSHKLQ